jgi:RNA polymerase sigma-70 factor (ECF subfamily)
MADDRMEIDIAQLVAEHHRGVFGYAFRLTGSVPDAEDLTQHVFLVAQQKLGQLENVKRARGWLFAIVRNAFLKSRRKRRPTPAGNLDLNIEAIPDNLPPDEPIDRERLQAALEDLQPKHRIILVMFYYESCSYREIAERLNIPIGTVMSRLARAKRYLRSRLFEGETEPLLDHESAASPQG